LGASRLSKELIEETISVIVKYDRDAEKVLASVRGTNQRSAFQQKHDEQHESTWARQGQKIKPAPGDRYGSL